MSIKVLHVEGDALMCHYDGQTEPQPAHVCLDARDGTLWAEYDPEIGGAVPSTVYYGHVLRWSIPPLIDRAANALLDEIAPLAQHIVDGYREVVRNGNVVGAYDDAAQAAIERISQLCDRPWDDRDVIASIRLADLVSDVIAWYRDGRPVGWHDDPDTVEPIPDIIITAHTTDDDLWDMAERIDDIARHDLDGPYHVVDTYHQLESWRDELGPERKKEEEGS